MRFDERVVVVTGVGRTGQVGEAVARSFAEHGARLALVARAEGLARDRAADLAGGGAQVSAFAADLADASAAHALGARITAAMGPRIHALVNLAGGFEMSGPVADSDPVVWNRMLEINLLTAVNTTRALLPALRAGQGAIVYVASEAVLPGSRSAGMSAYAAAKSAIVALMRSVAVEERPHGVRANALAPGSIRTADNVSAMGERAGFVERAVVADAVLWLCADASRGVSGEILRLGAGPV